MAKNSGMEVGESLKANYRSEARSRVAVQIKTGGAEAR